MTIAPIVKVVDVKAPPARAFDLFTGRMGAWWPKAMSIGGAPFAEILIEPRTGGRWFERSEDGVETQWGRVLDWGPPGRVLLAWQIDGAFRYDPAFETELELTFSALGEGTRVTLEHRHLERFGDSAERLAGMLGGGWHGIMDGFGHFVAQSAEEETHQ